MKLANTSKTVDIIAGATIGKIIYVFLVGIISFIGSIFLWFYEKGYGVEEYAEAYGSGLLSDFYGMINLCRWLGIILIVGGGILWYVGKKTEGGKLKALKTSRDVEWPCVEWSSLR